MGKSKKKMVKEAAATTSNVDKSVIKNKNQEAPVEHDEGETVPSPKRQKTSVCFRMPEPAAVQPVLKTAGPRKPEDTMRISDVSCHRARRGAVGPLLLAFSHAPCRCTTAPLLRSYPLCSVSTRVFGDSEILSLAHNFRVFEENTRNILRNSEHLGLGSAPIEKSLDVSFDLARPQKGNFMSCFVKCVSIVRSKSEKCEVSL